MAGSTPSPEKDGIPLEANGMNIREGGGRESNGLKEFVGLLVATVDILENSPVIKTQAESL